MVLVQLDLNEDQNLTVRAYMVSHSLSSKAQAVARIIEDYDYFRNRGRAKELRLQKIKEAKK